jgi:hypothetical protein
MLKWHSKKVRHNVYMFQRLALVVVALGLLSAQSVFAQSIAPNTDPLQFTINPETPGPNQTVQIQINGVGNFLGDATITWQVNGKVVASGVGGSAFSFITGGLGSETAVHVVINSPLKGTFVRDLSFIPTAVNLLWESKTNVPPFFKGKALYSAGSSVKVLALPTVVANGSTISSNNLSFQWKLNGKPLPSQSGKGHDTLLFNGDVLRGNEQVGVDVYLSDVKVGSGSVKITTSKPQLVVYEHDPLRGTLFDSALPDTISLNHKEITLEAIPYFFSADSVAAGSLTYNWTLNGQDTTGPDTERGMLTLRQAGSGNGSAVVTISMDNTDANKFLQSARNELRIFFGQQTTSAPAFGL